jgi:adenine phosphoribosyltransferase
VDLKQIESLIKTYPDFPKKGVFFKDIFPVLANSEAFQSTIDELIKKVSDKEFDYIMGVDARGFIFGSAMATKLRKAFIVCRKKGKLPGKVISHKFNYEYSSAELAIQEGLIPPGSKVLLVDDILATGNTATACFQLLKKVKADVVATLFFGEIRALREGCVLRKEIDAEVPVITLFYL